MQTQHLCEGLALPEGAVVTVLTRDNEHSVQLSPAENDQFGLKHTTHGLLYVRGLQR